MTNDEDYERSVTLSDRTLAALSRTLGHADLFHMPESDRELLRETIEELGKYRHQVIEQQAAAKRSQN